LPLVVVEDKAGLAIQAAVVKREQLVDREILEAMAAPPMLAVQVIRHFMVAVVVVVGFLEMAIHRPILQVVLGLAVAQDILETVVVVKMMRQVMAPQARHFRSLTVDMVDIEPVAAMVPLTKPMEVLVAEVLEFSASHILQAVGAAADSRVVVVEMD
jgi:hypothetical protein